MTATTDKDVICDIIDRYFTPVYDVDDCYSYLYFDTSWRLMLRNTPTR